MTGHAELLAEDATVTAAGRALGEAILRASKHPPACPCRAPATEISTRVEILGAIVAVDLSLACKRCAAKARAA